MKSFALALILTLASAGGALAAVPGLMSYQGRIKESGLPVTAARSVDISICPTPASALGCVVTGAQNVSVVNGLFRTTFTLPSAVAWETGEWYLQVSVGGTAFMPRERLAAVPYAIYASSASTLIPNPGDTAVFVASNVVIADSGFSVGGSTLVVMGGRVGVNVAAPASELEVNGTLTLSGAAHVRSAGAVAPLIANGTGSNCTLSTVVGSDFAGRITAGAGSTGTCTLTFATSWTGNSPVCFFQDETAVVSMRASAPTLLGVTYGGAFGIGDVISYICVGY
jgi:hypothetical protein